MEQVLVAEALGRHDRRDAAFAFLEREAAPLIQAAATAAGVPGWWPRPAPREAMARIAEAALTLLRGSRSSALPVWFAPDTGAVRSLVRGRPPMREEQRRAELERVAHLIARASRAPRA